MEVRQGRADEFLVLDELQTSPADVGVSTATATATAATAAAGPSTSSAAAAGGRGGGGNIWDKIASSTSASTRRTSARVGFPLPEGVKDDTGAAAGGEEWLQAWRQTCRSNRTLIVAFLVLFVFVIIFTSVIATRDPMRNERTCEGVECYTTTSPNLVEGGDVRVRSKGRWT